MEQALSNKLQKQLQAKKAQLETQLSEFATKDPNIKDDWDTKYPRVPEGNLEEAADEVEEYSTNLHVEFSLETHLKNITSALERLAQGKYGICEKCNSTISLERLSVSPEARLCVQCNA